MALSISAWSWGQAGDVHAKETAHDGGGGLVLAEAAGHEVVDLVLGDLAHRRLVAHLHPVHEAVQEGRGQHGPAAQDQASALQVGLDLRRLAHQMAPSHDLAAVGYGPAHHLGPAAGVVEDHPPPASMSVVGEPTNME